MKKVSISILFISLVTSAFAQTEVLSADSLVIEGIEPNTSTNNPLTSNPNNSSKVGRKNVFWIHGLAGGPESWGRVQGVTEDQTGTQVPGYPVRDVEGYALDYSDRENTYDIFQLGTYVNNTLIEPWRTGVTRRDTIPVHKNFAIAHSQGGIVARAIRHQNINQPQMHNVNFGALATFGTPHGGAQIINSSQRGGVVDQWINDGCEALSAAEIQTFVDSKWWLSLFVGPNTVQSFSQKACNGLNRTALPILVGGIRKSVAADYSMGASNLNLLKNTASTDTMKVVTFYSAEKEPVLWRTLHSMTYTTDTSIAGNLLATNPFGQNVDNELGVFVMNKIAHYAAERIKWDIIRNNFYVRVTQGRSRRKAERRYRIYNRAYNWLIFANQRWKRIIGARYDSTYIADYQCDCLSFTQSGAQITSTVVSNPQDCNPSGSATCQVFPIVKVETHNIPNDGVVTVRSQRAYPTKSREMEMIDINHMQQRNSEETRRRLNELFNGAFGDEFRLDEK